MKILITSIGTATAINLFKLLHEKHRIVGTDIYPLGYTAGSMMVDDFVQVPLYSSTSYLETLNMAIDEYQIDLLIPAHDYEVQKISKNIDKIHARVIVPSVVTINELSDKFVSAKRINELSIPVADEICSNSNMKGIEKVIKRDKRGVGSKGIAVYDTCDIPSDLLKPSYDNEAYMVQEFIEGDEYTVDVACNLKGEPYLIIPRCRKEVKAGVATKVEIVNDEQLIEYAKVVAEYYRIPGFSNIQFIKKDGAYYFVEYNYRFGGMSIASALASFNYVEAFVDHVINGAELPVGINQFPVKWGALVTRFYEEKLYEA